MNEMMLKDALYLIYAFACLHFVISRAQGSSYLSLYIQCPTYAAMYIKQAFFPSDGPSTEDSLVDIWLLRHSFW